MTTAKRSTNYKISTYNARTKLAQRAEPYWQKLSKGHYIGIRRNTKAGNSLTGRWVARKTLAENRYIYTTLGSDTELNFDEACEAARTYFTSLVATDSGAVSGKDYTFDICFSEYLKNVKTNKGISAARQVEKRLRKHLPVKVFDTPVNAITHQQVKDFRDDMVRVSDENIAEDESELDNIRKSKSSANRVLTIFRAALNLAFENPDKNIPSDKSWKTVKAFKKVDAARKLLLTDKQVSALLNETEKGFYLLCKAAALIGLRYGEFRYLRVSDFSKESSTLIILRGKTDGRTVFLSEEAKQFFIELCEGKDLDDRLFLTDEGLEWKKSYQSRPMAEAKEKAKLPDETVFYSLRHYHISKCLNYMPAQMIAENVGTSVAMIEQFYGKFKDKERLAAFNRVDKLTK